MKKNETAEAEEKKLIWKLQGLPTGEAVAKLVETEVITPAEARTILFREEAKQSDEVEALKEMVHALQDMVKDLLSRKNYQTLEYMPRHYEKVVEIPARSKPYWDRIMYGPSTGILGTWSSGTSGSTNGTTYCTMSIQ